MAEKKKVGTDRSGAEKPPFYKSLKGNEQAFGDAAKRFHRTKAGATPTEANRFSNMEEAMQKRYRERFDAAQNTRKKEALKRKMGPKATRG